jgi:spermidine synthase
VLLERFGIRGSALCAGALNLAAAVVALLLTRGASAHPQPRSAPAPEPAVRRFARTPWLAAGFIGGFTLLALEVIWLRFLSLFLNDTPLAFAVVLALVLAGISLGSLIASVWASVSERAAERAWLVAYAAGLLGLAGYVIYPRFLQGALSAYPQAPEIAALAAPLVMPTSLASGALFTLSAAGLRKVVGSVAETAGSFSFANTVGVGLGPLIAGFVLLPMVGMELALLILFSVYGLVGAVLAWNSEMARPWRYGGVLLFAGAMALFPLGLMRTQYIQASAARWTASADSQIDVREGLTATIVHVVHRAHGTPLLDQLATNAYSMSTNGFLGRRYMKLFVYLPLAIHPRVERALVVGYGVGNTAEALTDSKELRRIDVVDISRDMLDMGRRISTRTGRQPLDDPRVRVRIEDGRFYLQSTTARYDLITGEPPPPIIAGVVDLYTTEYFRLVRDRLSEGGIASYWLPVINISAATAKSVIGAFCAAFPDCSLWHGSARNFMLMGTRGARGPVSEERFRHQWDDAQLLPELQALGFDLPAQLGALFIGDADYLRALVADVEPLVDDRPHLMQQRGERDERDKLLWQWRDESADRERFKKSPFIASLWPSRYRDEALPQFDAQRVIDDLLFPEPTEVRQTRVLHGVLQATRLRLPVLLLTGSDPDFQRALSRLPASQRDRPEWLLHRAAGHLADRDLPAALAVLERLPDELLPLPDLREYVAFALQRAQQRAPSATTSD